MKTYSGGRAEMWMRVVASGRVLAFLTGSLGFNKLVTQKKAQVLTTHGLVGYAINKVLIISAAVASPHCWRKRRASVLYRKVAFASRPLLC